MTPQTADNLQCNKEQYNKEMNCNVIRNSGPPLSATQRMLERSTWPEIRIRTAHLASPNVMILSPTTASGSSGDDSMDTDGDES